MAGHDEHSSEPSSAAWWTLPPQEPDDPSAGAEDTLPPTPDSRTRPMRRDRHRARRRSARVEAATGEAPQEEAVQGTAAPGSVAPDEPTVRARNVGPARTPGGYPTAPDRPYDQNQDPDPVAVDHRYAESRPDGVAERDDDLGDVPYFHPLDPETPAPKTSTRRGWRSPPPPTPPGSPYDLSGLDPAELTGSLNLLGLEGPVNPSDVTRPIQVIQAPVARAPRRPMPPSSPTRLPERELAEPEVEAEEQPQAASASRTASLLGSSALMAAGTMVSRILGFVRAAVLVAAVAPGGDGAADAFSVANIMPNALYILLAGGVLNAVLVPQIARAAKQKDGGQDYINRLLTAALIMLAVVTGVVIAAAPLLVKVYGSSSWQPDLVSLTIAFSLWCLPQVFFYGLYTLLGQVLNARGKFGAFMWAPVINNVVSIVGLVAFMAMYGKGTQPVDTWDDPTKIMLLAGSQTLGVVAQAIILIPVLSRSGIRYRPKFGLRGVGLASASRVAGWTFAAVVVQQIAFVVISQVTTTAGKLLENRPDATIGTGKAVYDNAQLLFMLPHSLVAVSLVTALFTRMSNAAAENRIRDVRADLSLGLRLTGLATAVSTAAILALGPDITASMFPGNNRHTTTGIAYVVMAMALGLIPFSAQYLFQRVFYAFEDAKTPFMIQLAASGTWATGNLIALFVLRDRAPEYIVVGVGLAMSLSNLVGAVLSYSVLRRRFGDLDGRRVVRTHVEMLVVAGLGGAIAWLLARSSHAFLGDSWMSCVIATVVGGVGLLVVYVAGLRQIGVGEIEDVLGPVLRRLPSSPPQLARHAAD